MTLYEVELRCSPETTLETIKEFFEKENMFCKINDDRKEVEVTLPNTLKCTISIYRNTSEFKVLSNSCCGSGKSIKIFYMFGSFRSMVLCEADVIV